MKNANEILTSHEKFHINLGLERISKILDLLGNPQENYKIIHIAGTNGKGSTSKIINEILVNHGLNVGLFTSPHLFSYEERIRINNEKISSYLFDKLTNKIDSLAKENNIEFSFIIPAFCVAISSIVFPRRSVWSKSIVVIIEVEFFTIFVASNIPPKPTSKTI